MQRTLIDTVNEANREHYATRTSNSDLAARIASYELAFAMQRSAHLRQWT